MKWSSRCGKLVPPVLALVAAAPLSAQQGRNLLVPEEPARQSVVKQRVDDVGFHDDDVGGHVDLVHSTASERPEPTGVASAANTEYKYDDGEFERFTHLQDSSRQPVHEQEYAQRFRLNRSGTVVNVVLCAGRSRDRGNSSRLPFTLTFYRDSGGRPGSRLASADAGVTINTPGQAGCARLDLSSSAFRLSSGNTWIGIAWRNSSGMVVAEDTNGPGGTRTVYRSRRSSSASWSSWTNDSVTYGIRLTVDHGGGTPPPPDPDPDPDPEPPASGCTPTTTALRFDGGYNVSMCYRTPQGTVGQAKSGVWASGQAGILWFFDRDNAEVLVKVLDGCAHNGHRWAFVAPVTDLEFNLRITGPGGRRWTHSNTQGRTAATKSDNRAFPCSNEGGGDDDDDDDDGGSSAPDLQVSSLSASDTSPDAGGSFTLRATVRNRGDAASAATTLRYYRSSNSTIGTSDTQLGTDAVAALAASASSAESIGLRAPSSAGTYYYGACVDSVSGESNAGNNCSSAVRVTVSGGGTSGTRYNVGDVITTLPSDSWSFNGSLSSCSLSSSGGVTNVQCQRNGFVERRPYRYTCDASRCGIRGRTVTEGAWLETRR